LVTNPVDRTHAVLLRVSEFLKSLPADRIDELIAGTAKLEVVPKGGRTVARRPAAAARPLSVTPDKVRAELVAIADPAGGERYIDGLKLTVTQLKALAGELGISLPSKAVKAEITRQIVHWTVGRRLTSETISRAAPAQF
jgi:hypothetical protein